MPWKELTLMSQKEDFIKQALEKKIPFRHLCNEFGISTVTGYKWFNRYKQEGLDGLNERSRAPRFSPNQTPKFIEEKILAIRVRHPAWGARKLKAYIEKREKVSLPSLSTITQILHRHDKILHEESLKRKKFTRFEREHPNDLWQMDFKGHFQLANKRTCYPLTMIDDYSRFSLCLQSCPNERDENTRKQVKKVFRAYGLPKQINVDNGNPWGNQYCKPYTKFSVWLMKLGIKVTHSRPRHPQTNGKNERFHRSLKREVLHGNTFDNFKTIQEEFDKWRYCYNYDRPHQGINMQVPAERYQVSLIEFPEKILPIEYSDDAITRKVRGNGYICYQGNNYLAGEAFVGEYIEIKHDELDEKRLRLYFGKRKIYTYTAD
jgi:transposase InsO family protein